MNESVKCENDCRCWKNPAGTHYYASVIDGRRYALLAGPFDLHSTACLWVERARKMACEIDGRLWFAVFGTASTGPSNRKIGALNDRIGVSLSETGRS